MKRFSLLLISLIIAAATISCCAQVVPSAYQDRRFSITVGAIGSIFQPDYEGAWVTQGPPVYLCHPGAYCVPAAQTSKFPLFGAGAYVDLKYNRWIQIEAEGRWMTLNQYLGISQNNLLIGPRVPIHRFWKADIYGKALVGNARMSFNPQGTHGTFTDIAFGGGADIKLTNRISIRAIDVEYQYWPLWGNSSLSPYGASVGLGYKIF